jgi:predicted site-specific integrase-resolvase
MLSNLRTYISLSEAARRYDLDLAVLTSMIEDGRIDAVKTNGDVAVAEEDVSKTQETMAKRDELWRRVQHLDGQGVGVNEAARKYDLSTGSLSRWIQAGYIRILHRGNPKGGRGNKTLLNEADVAYAQLASEERCAGPGRKVFVQEFLPPFFEAN